ncbi:nuclear transport factor 2 family protein [Curtobacterium sp. MCPF17_002]|uniref:nuclear transport factor 2 family protein n=1 Tax=Curtobacterium sp. MCPF17_002 TaxID=2175645 RepID=UPI000DA98038|nr:nuclear transport factor 2 family protein [Curtobacterium sp. MCPF17_002]WIB76258.1 nuclear transport factor 2 family protein [Curtobacterium sp. MCPF17_002]
MENDPVRTIENGLSAFAAGDLDRWLAVCAGDVEFAFPFAPEGRPRVIRGRGAVEAYLRGVSDAATARTIRSLKTYRTDTPGVVVVELTVRGEHRDPTGEHRGTPVVRDTSSIAVVSVQDGRISTYRDYWNPQGGRTVPTGVAA